MTITTTGRGGAETRHSFLSVVIWVAISIAGAAAFGMLALARGETISAAWLVVAAVCSYLVAYRFYSRFIAYKLSLIHI